MVNLSRLQPDFDFFIQIHQINATDVVNLICKTNYSQLYGTSHTA